MNRSASLLTLLAALAVCSPNDRRETNKAIVRNYMEQLINQGNRGGWDIYFPEKIRFNEAKIAPQALMKIVERMRAPFPDLHLTIEDQFAEGDFVITRVTFHGVHSGELPGVPPSGRKIQFMGIAIDRIEADKVVEMWHSTEDSEIRKLLRPQ